jgi:hypothetical protein
LLPPIQCPHHSRSEPFQTPVWSHGFPFALTGKTNFLDGSLGLQDLAPSASPASCHGRVPTGPCVLCWPFTFMTLSPHHRALAPVIPSAGNAFPRPPLCAWLTPTHASHVSSNATSSEKPLSQFILYLLSENVLLSFRIFMPVCNYTLICLII